MLAAAMVALCAHGATAQPRSLKYRPTVYMIAAGQSDTTHYGCPLRRSIEASNAAAANAREDFEQTLRTGFRQVHNPQFVFATRDNRFALGIGGYINLRMSYDMKGAVDNLDFIPYDIPVTDNYAYRQRLIMDASTSRLFTKAVINSRALGRVVAFVDIDFRGGAEQSYTPRLRSAYVSLAGFTAGRDITTFCDLDAAPTTVDFQGPNAYNLNFATLLRYEVDFAGDHLTFGVAAEMPSVSGTYGEHFMPVSQRVPDVPLYLQCAWGDGRRSHVRASAVLRDMYLHNSLTDKNTTLFGWGVQASGRIETCPYFTLLFNGVYGKGITPYIQDLTGRGLDFTPNPANAERIQTMPMWAWQASGQVNFIPSKLWMSGGYSTARVNKHHGYYAATEYKRGTYIFGNVFYQLTPNCSLAAEYLHGSRTDMSAAKGEANRLSLMVQYNF